MARKAKELLLSADAKTELKKEYRRGKTHCYRERCRMVLLKAEGYRSKDIAEQTDCCEASVNSWVKRYEQEGIEGLQTKPGRGRKPLLSGKDEVVVRAAIKEERQRLSKAKHIIETALNKQFSLTTMTRFLKLLTAVTNE
jgi:transposase